MTALNFPACLAFTLAQEGGWSDRPRDKGGPTNRGITLATFREYFSGATLDDLRVITDDQVTDIYRDGYWKTVRGDDLPAGVDLSVFDMAVNAGPDRSIRLLQDATNVTVDGILGPISMQAITAIDPAVLIGKLSRQQSFYYDGLLRFDTFGRGWITRTNQRRAAALQLAGATAA